MKLFTDKQYQQLLRNGSLKNRDRDHFPVVKLYVPHDDATWLLTKIDPTEPDLAYGLCDRGYGSPDLESVYLPEILGGKFIGLPVERDLHFKAIYPISVYIRAAQRWTAITFDASDLQAAAAAK